VLLSILCLVTLHTATAQGYDPTEYNPADVEVINNLIANNGLQAIPNDPEGWENTLVLHSWGYDYVPMIEWDNSTPKQILSVTLINKGLTGHASFAGLETMWWLDCSNNDLTGIDVTGNNSLWWLDCSNNDLTGIDITSNNSLWGIDCSNNNLTELDLSSNGALQKLRCLNNNITELDLTGTCIMRYGEWPLTLTLHKKETGVYSSTKIPGFISRSQPMFMNPAISFEIISYENYIPTSRLTSIDTTVTSTMYLIQTDDIGLVSAYGYIKIAYSDEPETGISISDRDKLKIYLYLANDMLIVESEKSIPITTIVYDMLGKKVLTHSSQGSTEINTSRLQNGVYIVTVLSEGTIIQNTKIIK